MNRFRITKTIARSKDKKILKQWRRENVTYFGLFLALISFFFKKEFGFFIERMGD